MLWFKSASFSSDQISCCGENTLCRHACAWDTQVLLWQLREERKCDLIDMPPVQRVLSERQRWSFTVCLHFLLRNDMGGLGFYRTFTACERLSQQTHKQRWWSLSFWSRWGTVLYGCFFSQGSCSLGCLTLVLFLNKIIENTIKLADSALSQYNKYYIYGI